MRRGKAVEEPAGIGAAKSELSLVFCDAADENGTPKEDDERLNIEGEVEDGECPN